MLLRHTTTRGIGVQFQVPDLFIEIASKRVRARSDSNRNASETCARNAALLAHLDLVLNAVKQADVLSGLLHRNNRAIDNKVVVFFACGSNIFT